MFEIVPVVELVLGHSAEIDYGNQNTVRHRSPPACRGSIAVVHLNSSTPHPARPRHSEEGQIANTAAWSRLGLGCVKTPWRKHSRSATSGGGPRAVILVTLAIFPSGRSPGADSSDLGRFCAGRWAQVCDDYALIAAMSGWMPMMFMTRVRL